MPKISEKTKVIIMVFLTSIVLVSRYGVGTDYFPYQFLYESMDISSFSLSDRLEPGFKILMYLFRMLNLSFHTFAVFLSLIIYGLTSFWIYWNSRYPSRSLYLYTSMFFLVWTLSALRQGLVMSIALILFFDKDIKLSIYVKLLIIAGLSTFHLSALILIPLVFIMELNFSKKNLLII